MEALGQGEHTCPPVVPLASQMSSFVVLGGGHPSRAQAVLLSLLRMQPSTSADESGLCATSTLTAGGKVGLEVGLQLGVGLFMWLLVVASWWLGGCRRCDRHNTQRRSIGRGPLGVSLLDDVNEDASADALESQVSQTHSLNVVSDSSSATSPVSDGTKLPPRVRYLVAAVNFGVTAYSTITVATIKMLHCVWVPGTPRHQRRLFIRGSVVCDYSGWQAPYILVLTALVVVPVALPLVAAWSRQGHFASLRLVLVGGGYVCELDDDFLKLMWLGTSCTAGAVWCRASLDG
jgi:hypothetical protein